MLYISIFGFFLYEARNIFIMQLMHEYTKSTLADVGYLHYKKTLLTIKFMLLQNIVSAWNTYLRTPGN